MISLNVNRESLAEQTLLNEGHTGAISSLENKQRSSGLRLDAFAARLVVALSYYGRFNWEATNYTAMDIIYRIHCFGLNLGNFDGLLWTESGLF